MKRLVVAVIMAVAALATAPSRAQNPPEGYQAAEAVYDSLTPEARVEVQLLVIASGYSVGFPGDTFNPKLFEAIKTFQTANNLKPDGRLTEALYKQLYIASRPYLARWRFAEIRLPDRPTTIWVPAGLGLKAENAPHAIHLNDPQGQVDIRITSLQKTSLKAVQDAFLQTLKKSKATIKFSKRADIVAMVSYQTGNYSGHWQFHLDKYGIVGFNVVWNQSNTALAADRIFMIMGGSLIASIDRTSFPQPFSFEAPSSAKSGTETAGKKEAGKQSSDGQKAERESASSGTGFFVNPGGYLLTNAHVVDKCRNFGVTPTGGDMVAAKLVAVDAANDLALLKANTKPSAVAAIRATVKLGEPIAVFGYPLTTVLSRNGNFTLGNITALAGMGDDSNQLQISAPVQPGNSGGPLIDQHGNLVGVIRAKLNAVKVAEAVGDVPQNVNFAIKASVALNFLSSNGIGYTEGQTGTPTLDPVALAEKAKSISAFILCK